MGRIRTTKPEFFTHEGLYDLEQSTSLPIRVAYSGLWTCCDREGRFYWRPRFLKSQILPYDTCDFAKVLDALAGAGYVVRYTDPARVGDASSTREALEEYGCIPSWHKHQIINNREKPSTIPAPTPPAIDDANKQLDLLEIDASSTRDGRDDNATTTEIHSCSVEGKGREGKGRELKPTNKTLKSSIRERVGATPPPPPAESVLVYFKLKIGPDFPVTLAFIDQYAPLYPSVDVRQAARDMAAWCLSNPDKRKTKQGVPAFVNRWLKTEQKNGNTPHPEASVGARPKDDRPLPEHDPLPDGLDETRGRKLWVKALDVMEKKINRHTFDTWLKPSRSLGEKDSTLYVSVPSPEFKQFVSKHAPIALECLAGDGITQVVPLY